MKLSENFVLRQVAGTWVVLPLSGAALHGMVKLNESGVLLWKALEQGADGDALTAVLTAEYEVSAEQAREDVENFLKILRNLGCLEE